MSNSWGDFLNEKLFDGGAKVERLDQWKKHGNVVVWIHTATKIHRRVFHMLPYVNEIEDDKTKKMKKVISFFPFVCHEDPDSYMKKETPTSCPICRLMDYLGEDDDIDHDVTVWDSSVGDRKKDRVCSKADFIGADGGDWRLSFKPSIQYVLAVVQDDKPEAGIVVATEKFSLGEAIKKVIMQEIDSNGPELGDPSQSPYALKWQYDSTARQAADYYSAYAYRKAELTDQIADLLSHPAVELDKYVAPGDTKKLREIFEEHIMIELDLDPFFDNVSSNQAEWNTKKEPDTSFPPKEESPVSEKASSSDEDEVKEEVVEEPPVKKDPPKRRKKATAKKKPEPEPAPEPEEDMVECGNCGKLVAESATQCPHCDVQFEDD